MFAESCFKERFVIIELSHSFIIEVFIIYFFFMLLSFMCLQVVFHIEPYKERDEVNMFTNVKYIIEK